MTSEEKYCITKQPLPACPLVDNLIEEINWMLNSIKDYNKMSHEELYCEVVYIKDKLNDILGKGRNNSNIIEMIRQRNIDIRSWGEEWKQEALCLEKLTGL